MTFTELCNEVRATEHEKVVLIYHLAAFRARTTICKLIDHIGGGSSNITATSVLLSGEGD